MKAVSLIHSSESESAVSRHGGIYLFYRFHWFGVGGVEGGHEQAEE